MSKLDTPTAVAFRGSKCEVGELAADQPASNVQNTIANYMPHLGMDEQALANHLIEPCFLPAAAPASGTASAVVQYKDQAMPVALELAVAFQAASMAHYACAQVVSQGGKAGTPPDFKLALAVPTYFNARQIAALQDASAIAGFEQPLLVAAADALAHEYLSRHKGDLGSIINTTAFRQRHVAVVDIGHCSASAVVVRYWLEEGVEGVQIKVITAAAEVGAGAGALDEVLLAHFRAQVEEKYGDGTCSGPKATSRLSKACERIKKMLSTIDSSKVSVDGLIPDQDVTLELSRGQLENMAARVCLRIKELMARVVTACHFEEGVALDVLEIVGGGTRIPCVAEAVQQGIAGRGGVELPLSKTLDSNTAVCLGCFPSPLPCPPPPLPIPSPQNLLHS